MRQQQAVAEATHRAPTATTAPKATKPLAEAAPRSWNQILAPYKKSHRGKSLFQLITTSVLFVAGWVAMLYSLEVGYWLTLLLALPTAGLLTRLFIIQHDCGHGSFFRSSRANHAVGSVIGVLMMIPYHYWRRTHAIHHASAGDLDHREFGDISTLTVDEYLALSRWGRLGYRLYRNIFFLVLVGPIYQFVFKHRLPLDTPRAWRKEWASILWTNVALVALVVTLGQTIGYGTLVLVHLPVLMLSGGFGLWLFYVQHQFEDTYWRNHPEWDIHRAALEGSSFFDLPPVLHWFTGNIGYHHIHHLSSRIPNYSLKRCLEENPELQKVTRFTLWESLRCARLKLWDEREKRLIGFSDLRTADA